MSEEFRHGDGLVVYFGDRELGERPRAMEEINEDFWGGLQALIYAAVNDGSLGAVYRLTCEDGKGPIGTNEEMLRRAIQGKISNLPYWPWLSPVEEVPDTICALELAEFCWRHIGQPLQLGGYHDFFGHYHLKFDVESGRKVFQEEVNLLLSRNGLAYTLTDEGNIERLGPPVLREELISAHFHSGDATLDALLEDARRKFFSPRNETRGEALEKLWDAWERLKTTGEGSGKKEQITSLLDGAAGTISTQFRQHLEADAKELTDLGNNLQIRHFEVGKEMIHRSEHIDYLFHRLFNMAQLILRTKGT